MAILVDRKLDHRLPYKTNITTRRPAVSLPYSRAQINTVDFSCLSGEHITFEQSHFSWLQERSNWCVLVGLSKGEIQYYIVCL